MSIRICALSILLGGASVFSDDCIDSSKDHIHDVVCQTEGLETMCTAISSLPELAGKLGNLDLVYTLFAPTNIGFDKFLEVEAPGEKIEDILADPIRTEALLLNHLIVGWSPVCFHDLSCSNLVYSAGGSKTSTICLSNDDGPTSDDCKLDKDSVSEVEEMIYQKGSANARMKCTLPLIIGPDISTKNGVIHTINNVIVSELN